MQSRCEGSIEQVSLLFLVLAGNGGRLERLRVCGVQRCALEQISSNWVHHQSSCYTKVGCCHGIGWQRHLPEVLTHRKPHGLQLVPDLVPRCRHAALLRDARDAWTLSDPGRPVQRYLSWREHVDGCKQMRILAKWLQRFPASGRAFSLLACSLLPIHLKLYISEFPSPTRSQHVHAPVCKVEEWQTHELGCVFQVFPKSSARITKCQFGANGLLLKTELLSPWYKWRADAPRIVSE